MAHRGGGLVQDLATWKRNAGASHLIQKGSIAPGYSLPDVIVSNVTPPAMQVGSKVIYFLPNVALIQEGKTFGAVGYADLSVTWQASHFVESVELPMTRSWSATRGNTPTNTADLTDGLRRTGNSPSAATRRCTSAAGLA